MPRKKIKHTKIPDEKVRKSTLKRRVEGLVKKANELTILCGTPTFIILQNPNEGNTTLWPSQDAFTEGLVKFLNIPEQERVKKMVVQDALLMGRVKEMTQNLKQLQKKNEEHEMEFLMNQLYEGKSVNEFDITQLDVIDSWVGEKLKKLQQRSDELDKVKDQLNPTGIEGSSDDLLASSSNSTLIETNQSNFDISKGANKENKATEDQGEFPNEFNQEWSSLLSR